MGSRVESLGFEAAGSRVYMLHVVGYDCRLEQTFKKFSKKLLVELVESVV